MIWVYGAVAAAILATGSWFGYRWQEARILKAEQAGREWKASALGEKEARVRDAAGYKVVTQYVDRVIEIEGATREVIKEIPVEIGCTQTAGVTYLGGDWRLFHDAGVSLANGSPRVLANATHPIEGVTPSEAVETVVENYAICAQNSARLTSLQKWVDTQHKKDSAVEPSK